MSRIFINYRRSDSEGYVGRLYDHLMRHFKRDDIFMDVDSIKPGEDFITALENAVAMCDVFIAIIGPGWINAQDENGSRRLDQWNDFVRIEIASALNHEKLVIPVLVGKAKMPSPADLPQDIAPLSRRNAFELSHLHFPQDVEKLVDLIKALAFAKVPLKPESDSLVVQEKANALRAVRLDLMNATDSPLYEHRSKNGYFPVMGEGNPDANILFIGEAPGKTEAETGIVFRGPSGEVLDEMLRGINLKREDVYITNMLLDRPPNKPTKKEIMFYAPFLDRIINIIQPAVVVTLGGVATTNILEKYDMPEKTGRISDLRGKLLKTQAGYGEIYIVPLFHPAVVLYSATQKETLRKDFEKLKVFV
jgi:uracil-DNA glycosylase